MVHGERPMRWGRPRLGIMFKSLAGNMVPEDVARVQERVDEPPR